jgi:hypothetical protein
MAYFQYVVENAGAAKVELRTDEIAAIRNIAERAEIPGQRYPPGGMARILISTPELS